MVSEMAMAVFPAFQASAEYPLSKELVFPEFRPISMCGMQWYEQLLELNPREHERRDLTVAFAERQGGLVLEYLKRLMPHYWFEADVVPPGTAGESLGLDQEREG